MPVGEAAALVVCMKWGTRYGPDYVNVLARMVSRHLTRPHRIVCFTDDPAGIDKAIECHPLPDIHVPERYDISPWRKLGILLPGIGGLSGPALFLDLDLVITDSIDPLFDLPGQLCIIENWTQPGQGIGNSSVFRFEIGAHAAIAHEFEQRTDEVVAEFGNEQTFLSRRVGGLTYWPSDWVRSFKRHCVWPPLLNRWLVPRRPQQARIVVFHGNPKPPDAIEGVWPGGGVLRRLQPAPWVADAWR